MAICFEDTIRHEQTGGGKERHNHSLLSSNSAFPQFVNTTKCYIISVYFVLHSLCFIFLCFQFVCHICVSITQFQHRGREHRGLDGDLRRLPCDTDVIDADRTNIVPANSFPPWEPAGKLRLSQNRIKQRPTDRTNILFFCVKVKTVSKQNQTKTNISDIHYFN